MRQLRTEPDLSGFQDRPGGRRLSGRFRQAVRRICRPGRPDSRHPPKNTGPYGARRTAIHFILDHGSPEDRAVFLDADDSLKPEALETLARCIRETGADLVFLGEDQVYEGKVLRPFPRNMAYIGTVTDRRQLYKIVFQDGWYNPLWKKVPALSLLPREDHPEFYTVRFGEDLLQSIPLYRDCRKAVFLADSLYNYTQNPDSATNGLGYEKYRVTSGAGNLLEFFEQPECLEFGGF